jgi:hypothetical protein
MRFFLPENDDMVDAGYDLINDQYGTPRKDVYAHEIYGQPTCDGILVTKSVVKGKKAKAIVTAGGIAKFLRLPEGMPVMGDCGAFQFINEKVPPYSCEEICEYYETCGFDYGMTLDHLITKFSLEFDEGNSLFIQQPTDEMKFRYRLTLDNGKEILRLCNSRKHSFTPIGVVQGWSPKTYLDGVHELIDAGFKYLAIGGMARGSNSEIEPLLQAIAPAIKESGVELHFLGVARFNVFEQFKKAGVTSCDSASTLFQAFKSTKENYHAPDRTYCAVRIPPVKGDASPKVSKLLKHLKDDPASYAKEENRLFELEQKALRSVRSYALRKTELESAMNALIAYEEEFSGGKKHYELFEQTLRDRPWESCPCRICKEGGVDVIFLRGNNRNRRRGFHNTWLFYQGFLARTGRNTKKGT